MAEVFDPRAFFNRTTATPAQPAAAPARPAPARPAPANPGMGIPNRRPATAAAPVQPPAEPEVVGGSEQEVETENQVAQEVMAGTQAAPAQAPVRPAPAQPVPTQPVAEAEDDEVMGVHAIQVGTVESKRPINKFRGMKNFTRRIGVLSNQIFFAKTHYEQGIGLFFCFEDACCDVTDAQGRYILPIIVYDTNKDGDVISPKFTVEYLAIGEGAYKNLSLLNKTNALNTIDLYVSCEDEQYQKNAYQSAGPALWLQNEAFKAAVTEVYNRLWKHVLRSYAKRLGKTKVEANAAYQRLRGEQPGGEAGAAVATYDLSKYQA